MLIDDLARSRELLAEGAGETALKWENGPMVVALSDSLATAEDDSGTGESPSPTTNLLILPSNQLPSPSRVGFETVLEIHEPEASWVVPDSRSESSLSWLRNGRV